MLHPDTELKLVDPEVGYGVFATRPLPAGTITYVRDALEVTVTPAAYRRCAPELRASVDRYSYVDERGDRVVSWDFAKYVNHCCRPNSMSTGYGFEVALRDIAAGEQITDEYALFNLEAPMRCSCGEPGCRGEIEPDDFERYAEDWDAQVAAVLPRVAEVEQALWSLVDDGTRTALAADAGEYRSVMALRWRGAEVMV